MTEENQTQESELVAQDTQDQIDAVLNQSEEAISHSENGAEQPRLEELDKLSPEELLEKAKESLLLIPAAALRLLNQIKPLLSDKLESERKKEEASFEGEDFVFSKQNIEQDFNQIIQTAQEARVEEKKRIEEEKKANLNKKKALLKTLEELVAEDETEQSIKRVKELQGQWKEIKLLPQEEVKKLWDQYHRLLDEFYDKHSINIELKELDRKKNLEAKIELTKKVEGLLTESSIRRSYILLNKYHEEFRNTGPVPRESREAIWEAFKKATDEVYQQKKALQDQIQSQRDENLKQKTLLLDKAALLASIPYDSLKKWNQKSKEMDEVFAEWRKIGPVPKAQSDEIWNKFKAERTQFQAARKAFFANLKKGRKENLKQKEALCEQVEALKDHEDLANTAKKIIKIQEEWKTIGPVPDKVNKAIWNRFRAACDHFFARRKESFESKKKEEEANLAAKKNILEQLDALVKEAKDEKKSFEEYKGLSKEWRAIGYVPQKHHKKINASFDQLGDALFKKFKKDRSQLNEGQWKEHYEQLAESPNGESRLKDAAYHLKKKRNVLHEEILQMEQNISFFSSSSGANALLKDVEKRLYQNKKRMDRLDSELKVIKSVQRTTKD